MQSIIRGLLLASALILLGACAPPNETRPSKTVIKTLNNMQTIPTGARVSVENLVGHVQISQGGSELQVTATVVAGGKDQAAAQALADTIEVKFSHNQNQILVHVDYPVGEHDSYQYIPTHPPKNVDDGLRVLGFNIGISSSRSSLTYQDHDVHVYQGKSGGVPLHVDLDVKLPTGANAELINHVGRIQAQGLQNTLTLITDSGDVSVQAITGDLSLKSGSGDIRITDQHGSVNVHTGSGDVTGNGLHGDSLTMNAGSGDIELKDIGGALKFGTGSGDITLDGLGKVSNAQIECGSGDIELRGDLSGIRAFDLQTGSGDVTLTTSKPPTVSLDINASDITANWPNLRNTQSSRRHFNAEVGAATGEGRIRTGSGDVTLK